MARREGNEGALHFLSLQEHNDVSLSITLLENTIIVGIKGDFILQSSNLVQGFSINDIGLI